MSCERMRGNSVAKREARDAQAGMIYSAAAEIATGCASVSLTARLGEVARREARGVNSGLSVVVGSVVEVIANISADDF